MARQVRSRREHGLARGNSGAQCGIIVRLAGNAPSAFDGVGHVEEEDPVASQTAVSGLLNDRGPSGHPGVL